MERRASPLSGPNCPRLKGTLVDYGAAAAGDEGAARKRLPMFGGGQRPSRHDCHDVRRRRLGREIDGEVLVEQPRMPERIAASEPDQVGTATAIERSPIAQQHVEDTVSGKLAAQLAQRRGQ